MLRIGTVVLCALALAIFAGAVKGDESDRAATVAAASEPENTRAIEVGAPHETLARAKILKVLEEPTELDYNELSLSGVVLDLKNRHHIEIQLDTKVLEDASIGIETPVTRTLHGVTLRAALRLMLGALDLTYVIKDEVLLITTPDKASNELVTKIYPVGDLATPRRTARGGEDFKPLIEAITATIAPTTWDPVGGPASIVPLAQARSLVVSQTDDVQQQIAELLAGLRQARDAQPAAPRSTTLGSLVDTLAKALLD